MLRVSWVFVVSVHDGEVLWASIPTRSKSDDRGNAEPAEHNTDDSQHLALLQHIGEADLTLCQGDDSTMLGHAVMIDVVEVFSHPAHFQVTNQMVTSCKNYITDFGGVSLWEQTRSSLIDKLNDCCRLYREYQKAYVKVKYQSETQAGCKPFRWVRLIPTTALTAAPTAVLTAAPTAVLTAVLNTSHMLSVLAFIRLFDLYSDVIKSSCQWLHLWNAVRTLLYRSALNIYHKKFLLNLVMDLILMLVWFRRKLLNHCNFHWITLYITGTW